MDETTELCPREEWEELNPQTGNEPSPPITAPGSLTITFDPKPRVSYKAVVFRIQGRPRLRNLWTYLVCLWGMDMFFGPIPLFKTWAAINVGLSILIGALT